MPATLERTAFRTNRAADFFSKRELTAQCGYPSCDWRLVVVKELVDNALDACEQSGTAPVITITTSDSSVTVEDNGPGLPIDVLRGMADYSVRVSSNARHVSPTRGQQGNAGPCVIAMPYVCDGDTGTVEVKAPGTACRIHITTDEVLDEPVIQFVETPSKRKTGSKWTVELACPERPDEPRFFPLVARFALFNPHAKFSLNGETFDATADDSWAKYVPSDPTAPAWYTVDELAGLIAARIKHDRENSQATAVRVFLGEFAGLSGKPKQNAVAAECDIEPRAVIDGFEADGRIDRPRVERLLKAMQDAARAPKPEKLGVIGEGHLRDRLDELGADVGTFRYKRESLVVEGVPYVIECAFAAKGEDDWYDPRDLHVGVNWSTSVGTIVCDDEVLDVLADRHAGRDESVMIVIHVATPKPGWHDRGKTKLRLPDEARDALRKAVEYVTKRYHDARRKAKRDEIRRNREWLRETPKPKSVSLKKAIWAVLPSSIERLSSGTHKRFTGRNLYYDVRQAVQDYGACRPLRQKYFDQVLDDWEEEHGVIENCCRDPRGFLVEPHTGKRVPLGTHDVENYDVPAWRYHTILFIEKKGFWPIIEEAKIAERFDTAICCGEGYAVDACKALLSRAQEEHDITVLCLHDADPYGRAIARKLEEETLRSSRINVVDIGLDLDEAVAMGLPDEVFHRTEKLADGIVQTDLEHEWWVGRYDGTTKKGRRKYACRRVELNALSPDVFVEYLERKLVEAGCDRKVVPPVDVIAAEAAAKHEQILGSMIGQIIERVLDVDSLHRDVLDRFGDDLDADEIGANLAEWASRREADPWEKCVNEHVAGQVQGRERELERLVIRHLGATKNP